MKFKPAWSVLIGMTTVGVMGLLVARSSAFPQPSLVGQSWELNLTFDTPRTIAVRGIDGRVRWYWFLSYKVVNNTKKEQFFVPEVTIATDKGDIVTAGRGIRPSVFSVIKKQLSNSLLENHIQVSGRLLIGEDHAKESVAIWPVFKHDVDEMRIFIVGLSGESQMIKHPLTGADITLRKTLSVIYRTPGTHVRPQHQPIKQISKTWVMR